MLRSATANDIRELSLLAVQVWLHTYATASNRVKLSDFACRIYTDQYFSDRLTNPDYRILLSLLDNCIVGYIIANLQSFWLDESNGFEIDKLYVHPDFQGMGLGCQLLAEIASLYGKTFWLSTWVHNEKAIGFYKHLGFVDRGQRYFALDGELHENRVLALKST